MERYTEITDETKALFEETIAKLAFPMRLNFRLVGDPKLKKLISVKKTNPVVEFITQHQIFVFINEDLLDLIDTNVEAVNILFTEELNTIQVDLGKGTIKLGKHNLNTSTSVIDKFGLEPVKAAKDLERLTIKQTDDKAKGAEPNNLDTENFLS